jgi:NADPH-dependent 2,4-dienoyl-CoA reductase/sulfur reductase-like enzyme
MSRAGSDRRRFSAGLALLGTAALTRTARSQTVGRVVVAGGGFAGATCARALREGGAEVTLLEPQATYIACPMSNAVIAGLRGMAEQRFGYEDLRRTGIDVLQQAAVAVEADGREVVLADGRKLACDRVVLAPGIDLRFDALPGYDEAAAEVMPHAWKAGPQTELLRRQLEAMPDGGTIVMSVPPNPYRCPPGPYERASLVAWYLKTNKPRAKLLILDGKDRFSKQGLFEAAWAELYPGLIEWVPLSAGGNVVEVDAKSRTLVTEFGEHRADVANVIPPQRAGALALTAGVADATGWCPIDPVTFESRLRPGIHVIGDAAIAGAMPKSAFAANAQAKACAAAVIAILRYEAPREPRLINTCYSLVAPDYGISVAGVYRPEGGLLAEIEGAGGVSPKDVPHEFRAMEATYARAWFDTITAEVFG